MSWGRILYHACDKELVSGNQCDSESDHGCLESELRKRSDPFGAPVVYSARFASPFPPTPFFLSGNDKILGRTSSCGHTTQVLLRVGDCVEKT